MKYARALAHRLKAKRAGAAPYTGAMISLESPVANELSSFITGNACYYETQFLERCPMVPQGDAVGKHLILCGAGPSLTEEAAEWCPQGDEVWGCNSAATYLHDHGHRVTHGFAIDQTRDMVDEWRSPPPVDYIVASSVHPTLIEHLVAHERPFQFFHNYVGAKPPPTEDGTPRSNIVAYDGRAMEWEDWLYVSLYPACLRAGSGLNSVTRAIDVALYRGFARITVLGADCALRVKTRPDPTWQGGSPEHLAWLTENTIMHADGGHALASRATPVTMGAEIDGEWWETKPDMAISALWLVEMARKNPQIALVGHTLPNVFKRQTPEFLARLPALVGNDGKPIAVG